MLANLILGGVVLSEELRGSIAGMTAPIEVPDQGLGEYQEDFGLIVAKAKGQYSFARIDKCRFSPKSDGDQSRIYEVVLNFWLDGIGYLLAYGVSGKTKEEALFEAIKKALGMPYLKLLDVKTSSLIVDDTRKKVLIVEVSNGKGMSRKVVSVSDCDDIRAFFEAFADAAGCFLVDNLKPAC